MRKNLKSTLFIATCLFSISFASTLFATEDDLLIREVKRIEKSLDAQVGFAALNLSTGQRWEYKADQRFAMSSTFKTLACAALLHQADNGHIDLDTNIAFTKKDLVTYSPVTEVHADHQPMSLFEICDATMTTSDNTAANLVLSALGGPVAITSFARELGDQVTRLDRWETELNEAQPGDERDTSTPNAMLDNLNVLIFGDTLSESSRAQLISWMTNNKVSANLFRASLPSDWIIADRTGAGGFGSRSITAIIWPDSNQPMIVAFYITQTSASFEHRNEAIAELGATLKTFLKP